MNEEGVIDCRLIWLFNIAEMDESIGTFAATAEGDVELT